MLTVRNVMVRRDVFFQVAMPCPQANLEQLETSMGQAVPVLPVVPEIAALAVISCNLV
jgi:hypothetical protein